MKAWRYCVETKTMVDWSVIAKIIIIMLEK
jgi:hypothetical protein